MGPTEEQLKDKITQVSNDIERLRSSSGSVEKLSILTEYIEFLRDELKATINANKKAS